MRHGDAQRLDRLLSLLETKFSFDPRDIIKRSIARADKIDSAYPAQAFAENVSARFRMSTKGSASRAATHLRIA
jgi:hypothetical protein